MVQKWSGQLSLSFFAGDGASDLFSSWETQLLSIFSAIDLGYTLNDDIKDWAYLLRSFTAFIFFFSFLYIETVCLTASLPASAAVTVLGKSRQ